MGWRNYHSPVFTGFAHIAQSVEHFLGKEEVTGSNPVMSSISVDGLLACPASFLHRNNSVKGQEKVNVKGKI